MKLSRKIGYALIALTLCFGVTSCCNEDDEVENIKQQDYSKEIVGMWLNFDGTTKVFLEFYKDGTFKATENTYAFTVTTGTYVCQGDILITHVTNKDGSITTHKKRIRIEGREFTVISETGDTIMLLNRVKKDFSILNKYTIFNAIPQIEAKEGDEALILPEGIKFNEQDRIPTSEMEGKMLAGSARKYFSEIQFNEDGTFSHTVEGQSLSKPYTFTNNQLTVPFQPGNKTYDLKADIFTNETEDRLFIVIPNQRNWGAVLMSLIQKEDPSLTITDEQVEAMCDEQSETFNTFSLILSYDLVK